MEEEFENEYPVLTDRIQSIFIDGIFVIVLMFAFAAILERFQDPPDWVRVTLFFGIWAIYEPLLVCLGCTLGQYVKGIRVRRINDPERRINFLQAFFRYLVKTLFGWFSFLTIFMNEEKRALHDFVSGSVVVTAEGRGSQIRL